tara:strand:- start:1625 stop:2041 length:417 start_codon:yes stop_codon:yes gene_type:complete
VGADKLKLKGKIEEFYKELIPILQRYPKTQRYTLAENIEKETLKCVRLVFEAEYNKQRRVEVLKSLRTSLHLITFLLRISKRSSFIKEGIYEKLVRDTSEMGRITSVWIKREMSPNESTQNVPTQTKKKEKMEQQALL